MLTSLVNQIQSMGAVWVPSNLAKSFIILCASRGIVAIEGIVMNGNQLFTI